MTAEKLNPPVVISEGGGAPPPGGDGGPAQNAPGVGPGGAGGPGAAVTRGGYTGKDDFDGHVHAVIALDPETGTGVTESVGGPGTGIRPHGHAIVGFQVVPYEVAGYQSAHSSAPLQASTDGETKGLECVEESVNAALASMKLRGPGNKSGGR